MALEGFRARERGVDKRRRTFTTLSVRKYPFKERFNVRDMD
jgi:hypothetical protein